MKAKEKIEEKITGSKIYLRKISQSDVNDKYVSWLNDPQINKYLETRWNEQTMQSVSDFVKSKLEKDDEPLFAICTIEEDIHIGNIKLGPINPYHKNADVSLFIGEKKYWGKGFAKEAIKLITDYGFKILNLNKLKAGAYAENLGSINAFKKCGYIQEGLLRKQAICNGGLMDIVLVGITSEDYWNKNKDSQ